MSLGIQLRPRGRILTSVEQTATVTSDSGEALFNSVAHGLTSNGFVFIYSQVSSYNGFWLVTVISADAFKISEYSAAAKVSFTSTGPVSFFRSTESNNWNCVHQPIVYKIQSDVWPINTVDTARTVSSFSNYNGYTALNLSGDIKSSGDASALESVIISGTTSLDGTYKILNWFNDSSFVINIAYSASNSFSGGTVQYHYMNYHAIIRVYAGLHAMHTWQALKPYQMVAEIKALPDSSGIITVNVSEFIKKRINVLENDLLLDSLPNNIDAFCFFYIDYAESYDDSNGYTVEEYVSSFASDLETPMVAANCELPFKNRYSGNLNEYVDSSAPAAPMKFLTLFDRPVLFPDKFFDISFINNQAFPITLTRRVYNSSDVLLDLFVDAIDTAYEGIYRHTIARSGHSEAYITIQLSGPDQPSELIRIDVDDVCEDQSFYLTWLNYLGGFDYWNFKAKKTYSVNVEQSQTQEKNVYTGWPKTSGEFATTRRQQTARGSRDSIIVESQHLTLQQLEAVKWIISSPLVQIVTSVYDRRTVIVDSKSLQTRKDGDAEDQYTVSFSISYTNDLPSQSL